MLHLFCNNFTFICYQSLLLHEFIFFSSSSVNFTLYIFVQNMHEKFPFRNKSNQLIWLVSKLTDACKTYFKSVRLHSYYPTSTVWSEVKHNFWRTNPSRCVFFISFKYQCKVKVGAYKYFCGLLKKILDRRRW